MIYLYLGFSHYVVFLKLDDWGRSADRKLIPASPHCGDLWAAMGWKGDRSSERLCFDNLFRSLCGGYS